MPRRMSLLEAGSWFFGIAALLLGVFPANWHYPALLVPITLAALGTTLTVTVVARWIDRPRPASPVVHSIFALGAAAGLAAGVFGSLGIAMTLDARGTAFTIHNYREATLLNPSFTCEARDTGTTGSGINACLFQTTLRGPHLLEIWKAPDDESLGPELWFRDTVVIPAPFTLKHLLSPGWDQIHRALPGKQPNTNIHLPGLEEGHARSGAPVEVEIVLRGPAPHTAVQLICHLTKEGSTFSIADSGDSSPQRPILGDREVRTCAVTPPEPGVYRVGYEVFTWLHGSAYRTDSWWSHTKFEAHAK